jgi:hypothetical protein
MTWSLRRWQSEGAESRAEPPSARSVGVSVGPATSLVQSRGGRFLNPGEEAAARVRDLTDQHGAVPVM